MSVGNMYKIFLFLFGCMTAVIGFSACSGSEETPSVVDDRLLALGHQHLSEYDFFKGNQAELQPMGRVFPYDLNTALFSDYAYKARFISLPEDSAMHYRENDVLHFPTGTTLIKTFYMPADFRDASKGRRLLETRLLIRETNGWKALPYIWNDEQTDAYLEITGSTMPVNWVDSEGGERFNQYSVPTMAQCKSCHIRGDVMVPIGPTPGQLNRDLPIAFVERNQLQYFAEIGILEGLPENDIPKSPVWNDPSTGSLHDRAMTYLDINCGHCHNPDGPANTSALVLTAYERDPANWGVFKKPIAAGRGSGGRSFSIVPGDPHASILLYRMESTDPGIMMPEVGRKLAHDEGIALIRAWIAHLE